MKITKITKIKITKPEEQQHQQNNKNINRNKNLEIVSENHCPNTILPQT